MKEKESYLHVYPAWAWALVTFFISIILLFIMDNQRGFFEVIANILYIILIAIACFYICKAHPESVWYTPIICNILAFVSLLVFIFTDLNTISELIFWLSSFVVSAVGAIIGSKIGRKKIKQGN